MGMGRGRGMPKQPTFVYERPPPPTYICHRCNQPGHWIQRCPTNSDPNYDIHKVKKATGIPKAFLSQVATGDARSALFLPGGGFAVMTPNRLVSFPWFLQCSYWSSAEFDKMGRRLEAISERAPAELTCPACSRVFRDAVLLTCCGNSFCDDCMSSFAIHFYPSITLLPMQASALQRLLPEA
jgi:hypothetical protein